MLFFKKRQKQTRQEPAAKDAEFSNKNEAFIHPLKRQAPLSAGALGLLTTKVFTETAQNKKEPAPKQRL
ncbi:hypothetical protein [Legionella septentrionalis]|uniref:Uncharacterized protein n=1 Tax=Legionella septentrionalis TaxID=2498109 RepID=A0A433JKR7_9GAMM|nr:hypothetical protein [Legionella septentrionalis]RUQ89455.1 hypothetical protein EKM59_03385 [Legionella septentrionalis]